MNVMRRLWQCMTVVCLGLVLVGCQEGGGISKQGVGAVTGGALGGVLGSQVGGGNGKTAAIIAGTLGGALIGGSIGKSMDTVDQMKANQALESNRSNQTSTWTNPDNSNTYAVTPTRTFTGANGQPCRDFTTNATINGQNQLINGTACRDSNGQWRIVSN